MNFHGDLVGFKFLIWKNSMNKKINTQEFKYDVTSVESKRALTLIVIATPDITLLLLPYLLVLN